MYELASGAEVVTYFDQVMQQQFIPSDRVQYFPMHSFEPAAAPTEAGADGRREYTFGSVVTRDLVTVRARQLVDATYMNVSVPSQRPPAYEVAEGSWCAPLNELPALNEPADGYVVVGAGKTGADACLWLLAQNVDPALIRWIMPRDSWYLDRTFIQPAGGIGEAAVSIGQSLQHAAESSSVEDLFVRLEAAGSLLRLDPSVEPTMFRCSTVTPAELTQLRRIEQVVRMGRVQSISADQIVLDGGVLSTSATTFHIDCSADGLERRPPAPVFDGEAGRITLQTVRHCQQVFSAAFIAHIEAAYGDLEQKNQLCTVVPHPDTAVDWIHATLGSMLNLATWRSDPELAEWLKNARLDGFSQPGPPSEAALAAEAAAAEFGLTAITKLQEYAQTVV